MMLAHEQPVAWSCVPRRCDRTRRGISLIEMMVVMTGVAVMLGLCVFTIQLLLRLETDSRNRLTATAAIDRLAGQLRADAHSATKAWVGAKASAYPDGLVLDGAEGRVVTYQPGGGMLIRTATLGVKRTMRDVFVLGPGLTARFEIRKETAGTFVALSVEPPRLDGDPRSPRTLEVLAQIARDQRGLAKSSGTAAVKKGAGQ